MQVKRLHYSADEQHVEVFGGRPQELFFRGAQIEQPDSITTTSHETTAT